MEAVYAKCPDSSVLVEGGATLLHFDREAALLDDAIRTVIADVNAAGFHVACVEMSPDSVTAQTA